jgi:hypothetical protein
MIFRCSLGRIAFAMYVVALGRELAPLTIFDRIDGSHVDGL